MEFYREQGIMYENCAKVIVATEPEEMPRLRNLYERGKKNGMEVEKIRSEEPGELEPCATGIAALKGPSTGIVDFVSVKDAFARIGAEDPDPSFPFLGVHFTRKVGGCVEAGPNAVLGLACEGYKKTDLRAKDLAEVLAYPAFWQLTGKNGKTGVGETFRSISKKAFVRELKRLVPEVEEEDLVPTAADVRARALRKDG